MSGLWIITGASRGIGLATARVLLHPARPLLLTATKIENLEPALAELNVHGGATGIAMDLSVEGSVRALARALDGREVAGLINNAGVLEQNSLATITDAQIDRLFSVNLTGLIKVTRAVLPHMSRGGRILNVGSISGTLGTPNASLYNASKWALTGLTQSWAAELKPQGIFVAEVRPGSTDTDMLKQTSFPPQVKPEEVAEVLRFLAVDAPMSATGTSVDVFG